MSKEKHWFDRLLGSSMEILFFVWVAASLVECSFIASTDQGISVGVQTKQDEKKTEEKKPTKIEDGPQPDWK